MDKIVVQQGDCILVKAVAIPKGAKKVKFNGVVLKGEGVNTHEVAVEDVEVYEKEGVLYLQVNKETEIVHQEHGKQVLAPGIYKRVIEREYDYESEEARETRD